MSLNRENRLSRDVRTWSELNPGVNKEHGLEQTERQTILEIANKALESGQRDPDQVLRAARRVGQHAHLVKNLRAYATRAIFRVKDSIELAQSKEEPLDEFEFATELIDGSQVERIENRILIRELLETLAALDREIFVRRMRGETCPEIDSEMRLKPRTAEIRFLICKNALRKAFMDKLDRKKCTRGC